MGMGIWEFLIKIQIIIRDEFPRPFMLSIYITYQQQITFDLLKAFHE